MSTKKTASKPYHHGNLKEEFIKAGLEYIDRYGIENLSMRRLADLIGVSSAAPYAHFKNKDAFLDAIQDHITLNLTSALQVAEKNCQIRRKILLDLGCAYVTFFYKNPLYFQFLFSRRSIDINTFPPFRFYSDIAAEALEQMHGHKLDNEVVRRKTVAMWATVHGLTQFTLMEGILNTDKLEDEINELLCSLDV